MAINKKHHYTLADKIMFPLKLSEFIEGMETGVFVRPKHRGFVSLLFHTGVRVSEGLRAVKEQFKISDQIIFFDVGPRLKKGLHTAPLNIPLIKPWAPEIAFALMHTHKKHRVFPYCRKTGYNIVKRAFDFYPHHLRLSRITHLFGAGFTIDQVRSWTGHKAISSLSPYVGFSDVSKMGKV